MADFVAVLRKTVDALGENTPEMREKVFDKARATIEAKLRAIQPPPPQMVVDRQRKALEDAIAVIKADYAKKPAPESDETLEDIFASLKSLGDPKPAPRPEVSTATAPSPMPAASVVPPAPVQAERKPYEPFVSRSAGSAPSSAAPQVGAAAPSSIEARPAAIPKAPDLSFDAEADEMQGPPAEDGVSPAVVQPLPVARRERRVGGGVIAAAAALAVLTAGGYGLWVNRTDLATMVGLGSTPAGDEGAATTANELSPPESTQPDAPAGTETPEEEVAALPPAEEAEPETPAPAEASGEPVKFTQRLMPDGSEVDEGPAGGPRSIGEGTSVAAATPPVGGETATDASPGGDGAEVATGAGEAVAPTQTSAPAATQPPAAVAVGQKAIFYEERTSSASGSAEVGNIVWSMVQESPGGDLPPEPAIRAEATIPGKDIQLRMTIRRNGDQTLPASHIIEMIFLTPDGFEGGAISNVTRISFKETEQAAGNALIGIPAKIADGFFLIALGAAPAEVETNTTLLRRQSWIDVPITYQSGRRALLSMEKGIPGDKVFQDTLRAWAEAGSG